LARLDLVATWRFDFVVRRTRRHVLGGLVLGMAVATFPVSAPHAQVPSSEEIQRQREDAEQRQREYLAEKARVDRINAKVADYKRLMETIPFELVPGTTNLVQVYVNGHDVRDVARRLYHIADGASDAGFTNHYWPMFLALNHAKQYDGGVPIYGKLDPEKPDQNLAVFQNVRKQDYSAILAPVTSQDSALALGITQEAVLAYRKRLVEDVQRLSARGGPIEEVAPGPPSLPAEARFAIFTGLPSETRAQFPPRRMLPGAQSVFASRDSVAPDRPAPLDPLPPAWALRQGINMLGPQYEGYNLQYTPERLAMQPEVGPIVFLGGRDPLGNPRTQPGVYFALNQRLFNFLLLNESAFVAFSAGDAPGVNGGSLSAGLDFDLGIINIAGMVGLTGLRVVGHTASGPSFAGRIRVPVTNAVLVGAHYRWSNLERFRTESVDASGTLIGRTGVTKASYLGFGITLR
jgi:hypothetical protein